MPVRDMTSDELIEHKETIQRLTERERPATVRDGRVESRGDDMTDTTMPAEIHSEFQPMWDALALGKRAVEEVERLREENQRLQSLYEHYREQAKALAEGSIEGLSKAGYIVLREGDDIANFVNEPDFIKWVRWAMTDGWAELTAPTVELGWSGPQPNTAAAPIKAALGPLREELNLE